MPPQLVMILNFQGMAHGLKVILNVISNDIIHKNDTVYDKIAGIEFSHVLSSETSNFRLWTSTVNNVTIVHAKFGQVHLFFRQVNYTYYLPDWASES